MFSAAHKRHTIDELRSIVAPVAQKYEVDKVYIFGSVARGDHNENSDYDFYIESKKMRSAITLSEFYMDLRDAVGSEIDLISTKRIDPAFLDTIMTEGVILFEQ